MITVYQVDNRFGSDAGLDFASKTVEKASVNCGANYMRVSENSGESIAPSEENSCYYSKWAVLKQELQKAEDGDIIIYIDSDFVVKPDALSSLSTLIKDRPEKSFFISATITAFNGGMFAVRVTPEIKDILQRIIENIRLGKYPTSFQTKFGEKTLLDEVPIIWAVTHNEYNIDRYIYFLDTEVYNCIPEGLFSSEEPDFLPLPSDKTKMMHYMTNIGKNMLTKLAKGGIE